jgi:D-alanine--poly(phosphoribitol) ligase subunit 2
MEEKIIEIIKTIAPDADAVSSDDLLADGILDSFSVIRLVSELEDEFDISIKANKVVKDNFKNIKAIAALVSELMDE